MAPYAGAICPLLTDPRIHQGAIHIESTAMAGRSNLFKAKAKASGFGYLNTPPKTNGASSLKKGLRISTGNTSEPTIDLHGTFVRFSGEVHPDLPMI